MDRDVNLAWFNTEAGTALGVQLAARSGLVQY